MNTVRRVTCISALVLLVASIATCQTTSASEGFSFKGNPLGMTLEHFKTSNPTTSCFTKEDVSARLKYRTALAQADSKDAAARSKVAVLKFLSSYVKGKESKVAARDAIRSSINDAATAHSTVEALQVQPVKNVPWTVPLVNQALNEIACSSTLASAPGDANPDVLKVGSFMVAGVVYQFLGGKLYKVTIMFPSGLFVPVEVAFTAKYGESTAMAADEYQNGFGARWQGENFAWIKGTQVILIHEGRANGPRQDLSASSGYLTYEDRSLEPVPVDASTNF